MTTTEEQEYRARARETIFNPRQMSQLHFHLASSLNVYQFCVESKGDCCKKTEDVAHQDEVVAAWVRVLDDPAIVELVVDDNQDDCQDDADDADNHHGDV